jgi:hypothetical protein
MRLREPLYRCTPQEYLERERQSVERHEYFEGGVYAISDGSPLDCGSDEPHHDLIVSNVVEALRDRLAGRTFRTRLGSPSGASRKARGC